MAGSVFVVTAGDAEGTKELGGVFADFEAAKGCALDLVCGQGQWVRQAVREARVAEWRDSAGNGEFVRVEEREVVGQPKRRYRWVVEFSVAPTWVADGFDLDDEQVLDMLATRLGWANVGAELGAKVLSAPHPDDVAREQGYKDAEDRASRAAGGTT